MSNEGSRAGDSIAWRWWVAYARTLLNTPPARFRPTDRAILPPGALRKMGARKQPGHLGWTWAASLALAMVGTAVAVPAAMALEGESRPEIESRAARERFFEQSVRPLLVESCYSCHATAKQNGGLRLDSLEAILKGGDSGPALVPGKPVESLLVEAVNYQGPEMPPAGKLAPRRSRSWRDGSRWAPPGRLAIARPPTPRRRSDRRASGWGPISAQTRPPYGRSGRSVGPWCRRSGTLHPPRNRTGRPTRSIALSTGSSPSTVCRPPRPPIGGRSSAA